MCLILCSIRRYGFLLWFNLTFVYDSMAWIQLVWDVNYPNYISAVCWRNFPDFWLVHAMCLILCPNRRYGFLLWFNLTLVYDSMAWSYLVWNVNYPNYKSALRWRNFPSSIKYCLNFTYHNLDPSGFQTIANFIICYITWSFILGKTHDTEEKLLTSSSQY